MRKFFLAGLSLLSALSSHEYATLDNARQHGSYVVEEMVSEPPPTKRRRRTHRRHAVASVAAATASASEENNVILFSLIMSKISSLCLK